MQQSDEKEEDRKLSQWKRLNIVEMDGSEMRGVKEGVNEKARREE